MQLLKSGQDESLGGVQRFLFLSWVNVTNNTQIICLTKTKLYTTEVCILEKLFFFWKFNSNLICTQLFLVVRYWICYDIMSVNWKGTQSIGKSKFHLRTGVRSTWCSQIGFRAVLIVSKVVFRRSERSCAVLRSRGLPRSGLGGSWNAAIPIAYMYLCIYTESEWVKRLLTFPPLQLWVNAAVQISDAVTTAGYSTTRDHAARCLGTRHVSTSLTIRRTNKSRAV